jgi:hypothetical protein
MFFEAREHILEAFRKAGVREALLTPKQRTTDQYQQPGVWVFTVESNLERFNKATREPSSSVKKMLLRGNSVVRVEVVAQKEPELEAWVAGAIEWLLENPLRRDDHVFELFLSPLRFSWLDDEGVLPDTRAVMFEITIGDALLQGIERHRFTPELDDLTLEFQS